MRLFRTRPGSDPGRGAIRQAAYGTCRYVRGKRNPDVSVAHTSRVRPGTWAVGTCPCRGRTMVAATPLLEPPAVAGGECLQDPPAHDHPVHLVGPVVDVRAAR